MLNSKFVIFCILISINLIYGIRLNTSKVVVKTSETNKADIGLFFGLALVIDIIVLGISTRDTLDYEIYKSVYYSGRDVFETGFHYLFKLANNLGVTFDATRNTLIVASVFLVVLSLIKLNTNVNISLALYAVVSMTLDFIQLRNFLAFSIVIFSLHWLLENNRVGKIKYIIGVLVAASIHTISFVYLLLLLYGYEKKRYSRHTILSLIFVGTLIISALMKSRPSIVNSVVGFVFSFNEQKGMAYTLSSLQWGFLLYWLPELIFIFVAFYSKKRTRVNKADDELVVIADRMFWLNICISCSFPLCIININFFRILRNFAIYNYGLFPILQKLPRGKGKNWIILLFFLNVCLLFWLDYGAGIDETFWFFFE